MIRDRLLQIRKLLAPRRFRLGALQRLGADEPQRRGRAPAVRSYAIRTLWGSSHRRRCDP